MKKTFLLLFSATILCAVSAKAQTSGSFSGDGSLILPPGGGEWTVTIVVADTKGSPVGGASVSLPCSGQGNQNTGASGSVTFSGQGTCPCSGSPVTVIDTSIGCDVKENVLCGVSNEVTCP